MLTSLSVSRSMTTRRYFPLSPFDGAFVEPCYRANFLDAGQGETIHELGVFVKLTTFEL